MKMAAQIDEIVINRRQLFLEDTAHLAGCVGSGLRGFGFDQINNGFGLCKAQFPV